MWGPCESLPHLVQALEDTHFEKDRFEESSTDPEMLTTRHSSLWFIRSTLMSLSFCRWGKWSSRWQNNLMKVTQQVNVRAKPRHQEPWVQMPYSQLLTVSMGSRKGNTCLIPPPLSGPPRYGVSLPRTNPGVWTDIPGLPGQLNQTKLVYEQWSF